MCARFSAAAGPDFSEMGDRPLAIVDIALEDRGMITDIVEIVHKHDLSARKVVLLADQALHYTDKRIWRVDADWVLSQVDVPREFPRWRGG